MSYILFTSETFPKSIWSGGTTTQLYIYPKTADVQSQNFDIRISTAIIEAEESTFTKFDGYLRKLLILEGELHIKHEQQYSKLLKQFDQDEFSGDWQTKAVGKAIDFNVIYRKSFDPEITVVQLDIEQTITLDHTKNAFLYVLKGEARVFNLRITAGSGIYIKEEFESVISTSQKTNFIVVHFT